MIAFRYPQLLWALFLLLIPIIIHLINLRRYKKVYFSNTAMLQNIVKESKRWNRLRDLLILLFRMLAIAALVLAFAQPYWKDSADSIEKPTSRVSVYVDNSFSMQNILKDQSLFSDAKRKALQISDLYGDDILYQLLSNSPGIISNQILDRETYERNLSELQIGPHSRKIADILKQQQIFLSQNSGIGGKRYIISDFQRSITNTNKFPKDSIQTRMIVMESNRLDNIYIDSVWLSSPIIQKGKAIEISVAIVNHGNDDIEKTAIKLFVNGQQRTIRAIGLKSFERTIATFSFVPFNSGILKAEIRIDDDLVSFDNRFYFSLSIVDQINVLRIFDSSPNKYLGASFSVDSVFDLKNTNVKQIDYDVLDRSEFIILDHLSIINQGVAARITDLVNKGQTLLIVPAPNANISSYKTFQQSLHSPVLGELDTSRTKLFSLNQQHSLVKDIYEGNDLSLNGVSLYKQFPLQVDASSKILLKDMKDRAILSETYLGKGRVFTFSVPFDNRFSNLHNQADILVPILLNIGMSSQNKDELYYKIGRESVVSYPLSEKFNSDEQIHIVGAQEDIIPKQRLLGSEVRIVVDEQITRSGHYDIKHSEDAVSVLAMNYSSDESILDIIPSDSLVKDLVSDSLAAFYQVVEGDKLEKSILSSQGKGNRFWFWLIIIAIISLLAEQSILRWMK